ANEDAFVYYPAGSDPSTYVPLTRTDKLNGQANDPYTIAITSSNAVATLPAPAPASASAVLLTSDGRGSICIPAAMVRQIGLNYKDTAYVSVSGLSAKLIVSKLDDGNCVSYTVDHNDNIRITKATLDRAGASDPYRAEVTGDKIYIS